MILSGAGLFTASGGACCEQGSAPGGFGRRQALVALLFIVLLAGALRVYRLNEQSVWFDEYCSFACRDAPDLGSVISVEQAWTFLEPPLSLITQYTWGRLVGTSSLTVLRLWPVTLSLLCIVLVYALGARLYGRKAGLVSALLLAISPVYIWYGQEMRPYVLLQLLTLISMYSMIRGWSEGQWRWWVLNAAANLLIVWSHIFAVFFLTAEGAFLLFGLWRRFRATLPWYIVHFFIALSPLLLLWRSLPYLPNSSDAGSSAMLPWPQLILSWLGNDGVLWSDPFTFYGATWSFVPQRLAGYLLSARIEWSAALAVFFGVCVAGTAIALIWPARGVGSEDGGRRKLERGGAILLLLVATLPFATLLVLSYAWQPCLRPRYTSYSTIALYLLAGAFLMRLPSALLRKSLLAVVVALYGYQLLFTLPAATRPDWRAADRHIVSRAHSNDIILVKGIFFSWHIYERQATDCGIPIAPALTLQAVCEKSSSFLNHPPAGRSVQDTPPAVWAIVEHFAFKMPLLALFEQCLARRGLDFSRVDFPGMGGLSVYRIVLNPSPKGASLTPREYIPADIDYAGLAESLGFPKSDPAVFDLADHALRLVVDTSWFQPSKLHYAVLSWHLSDEGFARVAEAAARKAIGLNDRLPVAHFALAVSLFEQGDFEGGRAAFQRASDLDGYGCFRQFRTLLEALYGTGDAPIAQAELRRLDKMGAFVPHAFRYRLERLRGVALSPWHRIGLQTQNGEQPPDAGFAATSAS
jgi:hypothetical protein